MYTSNSNLGFLNQFKASNISSNRSSLEALSSLIIGLLEGIIIKDEHSSKNIIKCKEILNTTLETELSAEELVNNYIKFGEIFKSIVFDNKDKNEILENITVKYLSIARYLNDARVNDLAVSIAERIDSHN